MKAWLLRHWRLKLLFVAVWLLLFFIGEYEAPDYTRDPGRPWAFLSTLPAMLICFMWANQASVERRGLAGVRKFAQWAMDVVGDMLVFGLAVVVLLVLASIAFPWGHGYTRRAINSEMILAGQTARHEVALTANKAGTLIGAGRCARTPELGRTVTFAHVADDGLIVLFSERSESTLLYTPKMENGKTLWQCRGFPASAFPMSCRGKEWHASRAEPSDESVASSQDCLKRSGK